MKKRRRSKLKSFLINLFIPQEKNNFRAKLLHPSFLAFLVGFFLFNQTLINLIALGRPGILGYASNINPEAIISLTNAKRAENNLPPLAVNSLLNEAAQRKAADMFAFNYWSHDSPSGRSPWDFFREVGYNYKVAGENLAKDFADSQAVVGAWMNSPTHQANIMDSRFTEIGVAVVNGVLSGYQTTLVVQHFAKPVGDLAPKTVLAQEPIVETSSTASDQQPSPTIVAELTVTTKPTLPPPAPTLKIEAVPTTAALVYGKDFTLEQAEPSKAINPLRLTKAISAILFSLILLAITADAVYMVKSKAYRLSGRNLAHAFFLALIFLLILLSRQGVIN